MSAERAPRLETDAFYDPSAVNTAARAVAGKAPPRSCLRTVGLFSGIGGLELGLSRAGHQSLLICEIEAAARAVLRGRFGNEIEIRDDVRSIARLPERTELLVGGFPCQDLSQAGRTAGIAGTRSGLIREVMRLLESQRVPWVVLENVPFMLQLARGQALEVIMTALELLGYHWAYRVVDSRAFGLPQRRRRVLIVAALDADPRSVLFADEAGEPEEPARTGQACGFYWTEGLRGLGWAVDAVPTLKGGSSVGVPSPPAIWMPDGRFVTPDIRDAERLQGFASDWTKPAEAVGRSSFRWKLVGNAVSVPVAKWLGERLAVPGAFELHEVRPLSPQCAWPSNGWNVGAGRFTARLSEWPKHYRRKALGSFLLYEPKPLSIKATSGFLERTRRAKLRFPAGFIRALERHLKASPRAA
jgi:DNA (cytosine-5)-methyltransferase 1